jgi:hypothetical protein
MRAIAEFELENSRLQKLMTDLMLERMKLEETLASSNGTSRAPRPDRHEP